MSSLRERGRKARAFFVRDWRTDRSYRLTLLIEIANIMATLCAFYFLSQVMGERASGGYQPFPFLLLGMAVNGYLSTSLYCFSQGIRGNQQVGVIKALLGAPITPGEFLLYSSIYPLFRAAVDAAIYLVGGVLLGFSFSNANLFPALLLFILSVLAHAGIGILSATFALIFKKGDPFVWAFGGISWLLGGVFYPVEVLPEWLGRLATLLPISHALRGIRAALLDGATLAQLAPEIASLSIFLAGTLPVGILVFQYGVRRARHSGSLGHF